MGEDTTTHQDKLKHYKWLFKVMVSCIKRNNSTFAVKSDTSLVFHRTSSYISRIYVEVSPVSWIPTPVLQGFMVWWDCLGFSWRCDRFFSDTLGWIYVWTVRPCDDSAVFEDVVFFANKNTPKKSKLKSLYLFYSGVISV